MILTAHDPELALPKGSPNAYVTAKRRFIDKWGSSAWIKIKPTVLRNIKVWDLEADLDDYMTGKAFSNAHFSRDELVYHTLHVIKLVAGPRHKDKLMKKYGLGKKK